VNLFKNIFFCALLIVSIDSNAQLPGRAGRLGGFSGSTGGRQSGLGNNSSNNGNQQNGTENTNDKPKKGKILDDSTKQIYGPKTVKYFKESDIFNNRKAFYSIDTLFANIHKFNFLQTTSNFIQDLGNMGTAARAVFYVPITQLGTQLGYNAFDAYFLKSNEIRYFDTKSPYTDMQYTTGGNGDQLLKFDFNRSVNNRWNVGLQLQNFVGAKQYSNFGGRAQNAIKNWNVIVHNSYFSKDSNYTILANFNYLKHTSADDGGVNVSNNASGGIASEDPLLTSANTEQNHKQVHVYQQYALANGFQLYHILDVVRQNNFFIDQNYSTGLISGIYKNLNKKADSTGLDSLFRKYRLIENKIGIKGFIKGFNYRAYFRRRDYKLTDSLDKKIVANSLIKKSENFMGGWLNYYFKDSTKAFAEAEYLIGRDVNLRVEYLRKHINLGYYTVLSSPNLMQTQFSSDLASWKTAFNNVFSNNFYGNLNYKFKNFVFNPSFNYSLIKNHIYFDSLASPKQESSIITILQTGGGIKYQYKKFGSFNQVFITAKTGPDLIRIPTVFINSQITYDFKYAKLLDLQVGLEMHYKSAYYADAYLPITQQFYLQNSLKIKPGILADVFINIKLNRVRLMVKYAQLNNLIFGDYYVAPRFKGLKNAVSFGVYWPLFD
jgi:Putative porin